MSKNVKRLYKQFMPTHYDLSLAISDDKKEFNGSILILGKKVGRPSRRITLHQQKLQINKVSIKYADKSNKSDVVISRVNKQESFDELRIHSNQMLYPGDYEIRIEFAGKITDNMDGIYPCNYEDNLVKKQIIATQFESHSARQAFPCVDEPEAKATFQLSLEHSDKEVAISNTPEASKNILKNNRALTEFEITPIMSTYLLAFVIGELGYKEVVSKNGVKLRAFAVSHHVKSLDFALSTAVKSMDFYEDYYDIPFPLSKCDFVALPDFASGAMENWGLITFREQLLVCDQHTSLETKQYIAIVCAHELTHQWFGNLVTMRWWTDLWLNEGFASWMEYLAVDKQFPEWELWTQFSINEQQTALKADSLEHTHPIEVTVNHPDEVRTIFDIISYQKGASVIHMLHDYLGADNFREGLRHYLKKYAYKNTDTIDLWQALEDVSGMPVKKFMSDWTKQSGYPLLRVDQKRNVLKIEQQRFVVNPRSDKRDDSNLWPVPLFLDSSPKKLVTKRSTNLQIENQTIVSKINIKQIGFYRVYYSPEIQKLQIKQLDSGDIGNDDRMGLLGDSFEISRAGYQSIVEYLELLSHFKNESTLPVWELIASTLSSIRQTLSANDKNNELRKAMDPFIQKLIFNEYSRLGWKQTSQETHLDTLLRPTILSLATSSEFPEAINQAKKIYSMHIRKSNEIDPNIRSIILSTIARHGDPQIFSQMLDKYKESKSSDEKLSLTLGLTNFEQPILHKKVLNMLKSDAIRSQDLSYWLAYSLMNRFSRAVTWKWIQDNWKWLKDVIGSDLSFYRTPVYVARNFSTETELRSFISFFSTKIEPALERSYKQGIEIIETNIEWKKRDSAKALKWFKDQQY